MFEQFWNAILQFFRGQGKLKIDTSDKQARTQAEILNLPATISLKPLKEVPWENSEQAEAYRHALDVEGLEHIGFFKVVETRGWFLDIYADEQREFYAMIIQVQRDLYLQIITYYQDKSTYGVNDFDPKGTEYPTWQTVVSQPDTAPKKLLKSFLANRPTKPKKIVTAELVADDFCKTYARETKWRKAQVAE